MKKSTLILFVLILTTPVLLVKKVKAGVPTDPQYLIVNKTNTGGSPEETCCYWYPQDPSSITKEGIDEIKNAIKSEGTTNRRLGVRFLVPYLDTTNFQEEGTLNKLFTLAESEDFPILIKLDGLNWWESRSDLWNWWDPDLPGYDPDNKANVEWTDWNEDSAIKISWRNWGRQIRVRPHPNLASQEYLDEKLTQLRRLISQINSWYDSLPDNKKYLLAGVVLDAEISIGVNYYYYPNGNSYLTEDPANDPTYGPDFSKGTSGGLIQLGYAAVETFNIRDSGDLTISDLNKAVKKHAEIIAQEALGLGLPFDKIFVHGGGNFAVNPSETFSYSNVVTNFAKPAWSFYDLAEDVSQAPGISNALDSLDNTPWGAAEFYYFGTNTTAHWEQAMLNALNFDSNKFLTIQNWESLSRNRPALAAIKNVLDQPPSCWLSPAKISAQVSGDTVNFSWETPANSQALYLNVSNSPERKPSGSVKYINIVNENVTGQTSYTRTVAPGTYYWQVVADGCNPVQRRIAYSSFNILSVSPGDANGDGKVDGLDYIIWLNNYNQTTVNGASDGDFNGDGKVDGLDYVIWLNNYQG